jgi:PAS domain-containing protein
MRVAIQEVAVNPLEQRGDGISTSVFDALPFPAFIVDDDVRFLAVNPAAIAFLRAGSATVLQQRGGEILHCINSGEGCGKSLACSDCAIRGAISHHSLACRLRG